MRTIGSLAVSALPALARARGVTPYLPLNLHVEREATAADTARHRARAVRAWMTYSTQITATAGEMTQDHPKLEGSENIDVGAVQANVHTLVRASRQRAALQRRGRFQSANAVLRGTLQSARRPWTTAPTWALGQAARSANRLSAGAGSVTLGTPGSAARPSDLP